MKTVLRKTAAVLTKTAIMVTALVMVACNHQPKEASEAVSASDLKILYVGTDPDQTLTDRDKQRTGAGERAIELRQKRAPDFKQFLEKHFSSVKVVYAESYQEAMSAEYDVTIIDTYLPALSGGRSVDPETGEMTYTPEKYLSENYDHATIMIGEPSAFIGQGRQLKIDHLCLCLDAHAHGMKLDHPIFNTPYKVEISYEEIETPGNYKARYGGRSLGDTMPMWRMQTEGYLDGEGFPIGLVSTGYGFENGIDAEWISSGNCAKGVEATAIGRHANFLHWGFAAAPEFMTESARKAFINAVHYIAPYSGAKQITRKIKGIQVREYLREQQWTLSDRGSKAWLDYIEKGRQQSAENRERLQAKQASGEPLSDMESMILQMPPRPPETRAWTIRHEPEAVVAKFGEDWAAYENYYIENMDYFYPIEGEWYKSAVDEDAKKLGIANHRIELLDAAVQMLVKGDRTEMALRILKRYTHESYQTATEWSNWLQENRDRLYFSEGGGYKFIVLPESKI